MKIFPFFIQGSAFSSAEFKSKSDVYFHRPFDWKTSIIRKNRFFSRLSKISYMAAGFPWGRLRWDSLSVFSASLRPTLLAILSLIGPTSISKHFMSNFFFDADSNFEIYLEVNTSFMAIGSNPKHRVITLFMDRFLWKLYGVWWFES